MRKRADSERDIRAADNHDVSEETKPYNPCSLADLSCCPLIRRGRFGIATRVVVGDGERPAVVTKHGVQDLAHWHERLVDRALGDGHDVPESVRSVADENEHTFAP